MNEEIRQCYRQLELMPGAPPEQVKKAFHDLVKVWHPDRFAHDPALQQKAQEKLKEINLAYEKLSALGDAGEYSPAPESPKPGQSPVTRGAFEALGEKDPLTTRILVAAGATVVFSLLVAIAYYMIHAHPPPPVPEPPVVKRYQGKGFGLEPKALIPATGNPVAKLEKEAETGDSKAQFALGLCYENGDGILIDKRQALRWFDAAATNGLAIAQTRMGEYFLRGKTVNEDFTAAARWFLKAAEQGEPAAQCHLGLLFSEGKGVPQNFSTATEWYRKAAEQGNAKAQYELGLIYTLGKQFPPNPSEALKWFLLAARQGNADAQFRLGDMYKKGDGVERDPIEAYKWYNLAAAGDASFAEQARDSLMKSMTPEEILEGQKRSSEFKPTANK